MRWGEKETLLFVKSYVRQQCLWNSRHDDYKCKVSRDVALKEIIAEFYDATGTKLSEVETKIKIKNLRSTYCQELRKIRERPHFKTSLKWFNEFDMHIGPKYRLGSNTNIKDNVSYEDNGEYDNEIDESAEQVWVSQSDTSDPFHKVSKYLVFKPEPTESNDNEPEPSYKIKKKRMKRRQSSPDDSERTYRSSLDSSSESNKEDEFDIYGKYIASQLRKMGLQKALRVQLDIQNLVSEARISDITESQQIT